MRIIKYPKIQTMFKRDERNIILPGEWTTPELAYLKDNEWLFTEKVDGTNLRLVYDGKGGFDMRGRTNDADHHPQLIEDVTRLYGSPEFIEKVERKFKGSTVILFGEGYGLGYNGNYNSKGCDFTLFDVYVPVERDPENGVYVDGWWLARPNIEDVAKALGISVVPIVLRGTLQDGIERVKAGLTSQWGNFEAEGLVATIPCGLFDRKGGRIVTKIKARDFREFERARGENFASAGASDL